jgi:mono/diheme cytochrome c family protein
VIERGKGLYSVNCSFCHGPDLRGGQLNGPNLPAIAARAERSETAS